MPQINEYAVRKELEKMARVGWNPYSVTSKSKREQAQTMKYRNSYNVGDRHSVSNYKKKSGYKKSGYKKKYPSKYSKPKASKYKKSSSTYAKKGYKKPSYKKKPYKKQYQRY